MKEINVKAFIKNEGSILFGDREIKSIKIEVPKKKEVHSKPDTFGIAFNIAFDYELFVKGYIKEYEPHRGITPISERMRKILKRVEEKQDLNASELLELVKQENLYRFSQNPAFYLQLDSQKITELEIQNMETDMKIISDGIVAFFSKFSEKDKFIQNPGFFSSQVNIFGDGDFIINDILFEIKCVSNDDIDTKVQKQLILYKLINDLDGDKKKYIINNFGYFNPLKGQIHVWNSTIPTSVIQNWKKFLLLQK